MLRTLLICAALVGALPLSGQSHTSVDRPRDPSGLVLTAAPLSLLGRYRRLRVGLLWQRSAVNYLLDLEYGPGLPHGIGSIGNDAPVHFYGLRPEFRVQLGRKRHREGSPRQFVGLEIPVSYLHTRVDGGKFFDANGDFFAFDAALRHRERISMLAKYTASAAVNRRLHLEGYLGFGRARRKNYYSELVNLRPEDTIFAAEGEWGMGGSPSEGADWVLDLAFGFRVGYRL